MLKRAPPEVDTSGVTTGIQPAETVPHAKRGQRRLPAYLNWALVGTALVLGLLLLDVRASGQGIVRPLQPGSKGPSASVVTHDFPNVQLPDSLGLDGQQFYAIARDPFHPKAVAPSLDNPQYRYHRPLLPMLAWALHPSGGGPGLVVALVAIGLAGLFIGALAMGALSDVLRGPPWLALLLPLLPGAVWALLSSVADGLAVSLSLVIVVAVLRGRHRLAWCAAIAAVLTKETAILVPLALVLGRRRKEDLPLLVLPSLALAAWLVVVRIGVPSGGLPTEQLVVPFTGLLEAFRTRWLHGKELIGMASTVSAFVIGAFVMARRRGPSELRWVIGVQMAFLTVCSADVLGNDFGGTRSTLMLLALGIAVIVSGTRRPVPVVPASEHGREPVRAGVGHRSA